jgi:hypothetical protein
MAEAVRREMRSAGWGAKSSELRDCGSACDGRGVSKRTREGCAGDSTDVDRARERGSSRFGVRRSVCAALPDELDARERLCWAR